MSLARRYGTAIAAVAITVALKFLVDGLGTDHPFVLLPVPVAIAAAFTVAMIAYALLIPLSRYEPATESPLASD